MTVMTPEKLLEELHRAADIVAGMTATLADPDIKAPSELPGWSRGHVLAHIAGISNAMARQLEYAARGETIELYDGGYEGRSQAIEMAAGHSAAEHRADVSAALARVLGAFDSLEGTGRSGPAGWQQPISFRGGVAFDGGLAIWRELVIHASDLGMGRGPETWNRPFCEHLFDFLSARVPEGQRFILQPLALPPVTIGSGAQSTAVGGMLTDIAAWLAGRTPTLGSLRATAAADGVDLPHLEPWPAAVAPAR
ncbi:maleylpyruvate isomerase family mycothiol-dependent enzyme [Arthrobacter oryzae]|uniref:Maleylpyruvate isomerase family mycothiol-dependent enzyme n=1 Tax=Arthrobacter oryzae TaxID=409290 RepID=A0A3N0BYM3_9MICC|nr:maleylpyruvate isomerase family mycothiol-dependent enzyme [Arthrobacter oryzae]RNL55033.1 maleylpyruvate isomerase family mycothiol-dependent enzyme [Arthrobacter oryzae]